MLPYGPLPKESTRSGHQHLWCNPDRSMQGSAQWHTVLQAAA